MERPAIVVLLSATNQRAAELLSTNQIHVLDVVSISLAIFFKTKENLKQVLILTEEICKLLFKVIWNVISISKCQIQEFNPMLSSPIWAIYHAIAAVWAQTVVSTRPRKQTKNNRMAAAVCELLMNYEFRKFDVYHIRMNQGN